MNQHVEPITAKMKEEQEQARAVTFRKYSLDCLLALEAFDDLYGGLRDAFDALPTLQKVTHAWMMEGEAILGLMPGNVDKSIEELEEGFRTIASELPQLILLAREMRATIFGSVATIRGEALQSFDQDYCRSHDKWWLDEIRKDGEWLIAIGQANDAS